MSLPFTLKSTPQILPLSIFLTCSFTNKLREGILNIIEWFSVAGDFRHCSNALSACIQLCSQLKVPLADDKTKGSATSLIQLGFVLNSEKFELSLHLNKKQKGFEGALYFCISGNLNIPHNPWDTSVPSKSFTVWLCCVLLVSWAKKCKPSTIKVVTNLSAVRSLRFMECFPGVFPSYPSSYLRCSPQGG